MAGFRGSDYRLYQGTVGTLSSKVPKEVKSPFWSKFQERLSNPGVYLSAHKNIFLLIQFYVLEKPILIPK
jgi:hypothetical protein